MKSESSNCVCLSSGGTNGFSDNLLACAPCPPWTFQYGEFVTFAEEHNLSACEIGRIAVKCGLEATPKFENITFENITDVSVDNVTESLRRTVSQGQDTLEPWLVAVIASSCALVVMVVIIGYIVVFSRHRLNKSSDKSVKSKGQLSTRGTGGIHTQRKQGSSNEAFADLENTTRQKDAKSTLEPDIQEVVDIEEDLHNVSDEITDKTECSEMAQTNSGLSE